MKNYVSLAFILSALFAIFYKRKTSYSEQMAIGKKVEMEHKDYIIDLAKKLKPDISDYELNRIVEEASEQIADIHIKEKPDYYTLLLTYVE